MGRTVSGTGCPERCAASILGDFPRTDWIKPRANQ